MPKDPVEYGKAFLKSELGYTDEQIAALPTDKITSIGSHVLRQEDYSKAMDAHKVAYDATSRWKAELTGWKAGVDAELKRGQDAIARLADLDKTGGAGNLNTGSGDGAVTPAPAPKIDLTGYIKKEDLDRYFGSSTAYATDVATVVSGLVAAHQAEFGQPLDTRKLLQFCREKQLQFEAGYDAFVKDARDAREKVRREDEIKAAEERGFKRALSEASSALPFPTGPGAMDDLGNHTLDGITDSKNYDKGTAVSRAVQSYNAEIAKRHAS